MSLTTEVPPARDRIEESRRWPVRIAGALLLIQGSGMGAVALRLGLREEWTGVASTSLSAAVTTALSTAGLFWIISLLAFVAAFGLLAVRSGAWLAAMIVQALTLAIALSSHFRDGPVLGYAPMAYGAFMVFYINSRPVRTILHGTAEGPDDGG